MAQPASRIEEAKDRKTEGMGSRVAVSIITVFGLVIALILWLSFYASSYNVYQNIAVAIVMILAFIAIMGATWAPWGMKQAFKKEARKVSESKREQA
jgi:protein-S-isoprenylcysteine O-methyltransferase Ste14